MRAIECQGCGELGCDAPVRLMIVSRVGERYLCESAAARYEEAGFVVSDVYAQYSDPDSDRPEIDRDVLRALGHHLK